MHFNTIIACVFALGGLAAAGSPIKEKETMLEIKQFTGANCTKDLGARMKRFPGDSADDAVVRFAYPDVYKKMDPGARGHGVCAQVDVLHPHQSYLINKIGGQYNRCMITFFSEELCATDGHMLGTELKVVEGECYEQPDADAKSAAVRCWNSDVQNSESD